MCGPRSQYLERASTLEFKMSVRDVVIAIQFLYMLSNEHQKVPSANHQLNIRNLWYFSIKVKVSSQSKKFEFNVFSIIH